MKQSVLIGILLTLLAGLMIAISAAVFMSQGRQTLLNRIDRLQGEVDGLNNLLVENDAALATREAELAAAVAAQATLASERDASQQLADERQRELNDVISERDRALADLATLEASQSEIGPLTMIVQPEAGAVFPLDQPVEIVVSASDPAGLTAVHLTINDVPFQVYTPDDSPLFTAIAAWQPTTSGEHILGLRAINISGQASTPLTRTVTIEAGGNAGRPDPNAAQRAGVERVVANLRGLQPTRPVTPTLLTRAELRLRLEAELEAETPDENRRTVLSLSAFDFLDRDFDLFRFNVDLYSEQVGGFYDPETAEFVIVSDDDWLSLLEESVHAHEFVHALQDQHFQLSLLDDDSLDSEAAAALRALAEGEATLVQQLFLIARYLAPDDLAAALAEHRTSSDRSATGLATILAGYLTVAQLTDLLLTFEDLPGETAVIDSAPPILAASLQFPYVEGVAFADHLFEHEGGFTALDAAWQNLPISTEQILHPERYLAGDVPQVVSLSPLTTTLGAGWQMIDEDIMGEFSLRLYLGQQLTPDRVDAAATGWGGDRYAVYWHEADAALVMVLRLAWDSPTDQQTFATHYPDYPAGLYNVAGRDQADGATCWRGADVICLYQVEGDSLIVRAPTLAVAQHVAARHQ